MNPQQPVGNPDNTDYSKPVAYDQQGNPLYAHPPEKEGVIDNGVQPIDDKPWLGQKEAKNRQPSQHFQEASARLTSEGRSVFGLIEFDDKEELVAEIRKHWFGLLLLWFVGLLATVVIGGVPFLLLGQSDFLGVSNGGYNAAVAGIGLFLGVMGFIVTALVAYMFTKNVVFVTSEKIAQVSYTGLIHRKISQLNVGDVQDVSVRQSTIPSRIFNYGTLVIETAGEQNNYVFAYVPEPYQQSKAIIWAHEEYTKLYGN